MHEKIIQNKKVIALVLTSIILFSSYAPFLAEYLNRFNQPNSNIGDPNLADYLYEHNVDKTTYNFKAVGECFVVVEIEDINFTEFILDNQLYTVSYGLNIIPVDFSNPTHELYIQFSDLQYFKSLTVEPLILAAGTLETSKTQDKVINFQAGGPISILVRPTFAYNWLYVELKNASGGSTLLKRIHDTADYPEIDPLFYCLFVERGSYIRYDITLEPGANKLILRGDGQVEYKILVNSDWDRDYLNDVDEVQQTDMYQAFDLNPTIPDIWGFFEKSDETVLYTSIEEQDFTDPSPLLVNLTIIENLFATNGVPKVSPEALQTFNTLLADVTRKVIVGSSLKYQAEKIAGELSEQKIHQYFQELITFTDQ